MQKTKNSIYNINFIVSTKVSSFYIKTKENFIFFSKLSKYG